MKKLGIGIIGILLCYGIYAMVNKQKVIKENAGIITFEVNPQAQKLKFYWKDDAGNPFGNIGKLKDYLESKDQALLFAMNAGMFKKNLSPVGFIYRKWN